MRAGDRAVRIVWPQTVLQQAAGTLDDQSGVLHSRARVQDWIGVRFAQNLRHRGTQQIELHTAAHHPVMQRAMQPFTLTTTASQGWVRGRVCSCMFRRYICR